jgi:type IX secretion system PorP/SprF family membrane protein
LVKRILFSVLLACSLNSDCIGQLWQQMSMTSLNPYRDISAYAGLDRVTSITGHIRSQWTQFDKSPKNQYLGIHSPVYVWNGAAGIEFINQSAGDTKIQRIRLGYNNVQGFGNGLLSIGGRIGIVQASLDGNALITPEGDYSDGNINHNDPVLSNNLQNGITPTWEFSALFTNQNLTIGTSLMNFPAVRLKTDESQLGLNPQLNFYSNYFYSFSENIDLQLSLTLRSDFIAYQSEVNSILKINGNIFGGIGMRGYSSSSFDAIGILVGHSLNDKLSVFYSYDIGISKLKSEHDGSHELLVKYRLDKLFGTGLPPKIIYNPRFL